MAGAGFKTFNTGDVLTAADVNTYLMQQTVMVFADSAARTTALGANVSEGMLSYLKDTNQVEVYNGSSWVASDDPNAIQNTIVDAKGDLISATAADTPARLAVGADGTYLQADSSTATGLKWGTVSAGGMTSIASGSLSGTSTTLTSISGSYKELLLLLNNVSNTNANYNVSLEINGLTSATYSVGGIYFDTLNGAALTNNVGNTNFDLMLGQGGAEENVAMSWYVNFPNYTSTSNWKMVKIQGVYESHSGNWQRGLFGAGLQTTTNAITSIKIITNGTVDSGTYILYGVN